jgi:hypothetical protein
MASVGSSWCVVVLVLTSPSTAMGGAGAWSSRNFLLHYTPRELSAKSNYLLFAMFILFLKSLGMMPSRGQFLKYEFLFLIKFMGLESRCIQAQACTGPEAHIWSSWIWSYNWFWVIEHGCWKPNWGPLQEQYMLFNQWTLSPTPSVLFIYLKRRPRVYIWAPRAMELVSITAKEDLGNLARLHTFC